MTAGWGSSTPRGGWRGRPCESCLDIYKAAEVKQALSHMGGQPDEVAVHRIHWVVHRKGGLAGQVAYPVLIHEAVFGGHGDFLMDGWDNTPKRVRTPGVSVPLMGWLTARRERRRGPRATPAGSRTVTVQHNVHYPTCNIGPPRPAAGPQSD